jgi:hypothetical protein
MNLNVIDIIVLHTRIVFPSNKDLFLKKSKPFAGLKSKAIIKCLIHAPPEEKETDLLELDWTELKKKRSAR